jgi:diguanylate cyclase (GGDEF)-like protein
MGRSKIQRVCAWLAAMCVAGLARAADPLVGSPPSHRFSPDLDVNPQNYSVAQDRDGIVYLGNQGGVLEFDGESWRLLRLPNEEIVRTLVADPDTGRVYVGGYNSFGLLERDAAGQLVYRELADRFAEQTAGREFADIWDILVAPEGVYFRAVRDVFFWDPSGKAPDAHWFHEGRFGAIAHDHGATLLQFRGEGIKRRTPQGWVLQPETAPLQTLVYRLLPLAGGGLLTSGSDGAWWEWKDGTLATATMPEGMPPSSQFENSLRLADGSLAFSARDGVVYIVSPDRRSERHFKLASDFLTDMAPAIDGGFLLPGDQAVYRVAWPTAWSVMGSEDGANGSLFGLAQWDDRRFLMTSSGAHEVLRAAGGSMRFGPDPWEPLTAYDLLGIGPGRALLARAHKLLVAEDGRTRELSPELVYPRLLVRSRFHPERVFVGTENGLRVATVAGADVALSGRLDAGEALRVTSLAETAADEAWVGSERDGVWRYRFDADGKVASLDRIGEAQGLRSGRIAESWVERMADGTLVASTREGWFRKDGDRFVAEAVGNLGALRRPGELLRLVQAPGSDRWAYGVNRLFHEEAPSTWSEMDVGGYRRGGFVAHAFDADGRAMFIGGQGVLLQEARSAAPPAGVPGVRLRAVTLIHPDGTREPQSLARGGVVPLPPGDYSIRFEFALPDLANPGSQRYRGRLVGYEKEFSEWARSHGYTYSRLRPGDYRFELQAMDAHGRVTSIEPLNVRVEPRWHATRTARLLAAAILLGLLWLVVVAIIRLRTQRLAAQKRALEDTVAQRTSELADANRRLEMMAHIDGLTGIPNRRRLDEYLAAVWTQCGERRRPLSLLAIDVDRFKDFNDRRGHLAGDELLRQLADRLAFCLRRSEDLLARYGGEEFLVVMPGADLMIAATLAEKMRHEIETSGLGATISVGVSSRVPDENASLTDLVARADAALYLAKKAGRNRVEMAEAHSETPA